MVFKHRCRATTRKKMVFGESKEGKEQKKQNKYRASRAKKSVYMQCVRVK